ncbi:carbohydrate kinase family protein [Luteolibacter luteus]|uniref:Carbohydrate kinase n=1 Tax=Luteolibacter luteus TaxID=2728835 RepID=A0A858RF65_9BACT|nr:carbohydrate kinase [Luteolibacter luteus]QJE95251.1 carbohydrate kinase [Luteolibacter luteus]
MKPKVIGIGELLWDVLPSGPRMGGAPANFACHARSLGADSRIVSRVGQDELGEGLIRSLGELGITTAGISRDENHPTGTVEVELGTDGQPTYTILSGVAWDCMRVDPSLFTLMGDADAVCFGTLGQRASESREAIQRLVQATPTTALRIFDVNLRQNFFSAELIHESLQMVNVLKLSDSELPVIAGMLSLEGSVQDQLGTLLDRYELRMIAYTRGAAGSILRDRRDWHEHPGLRAEVKDTIGAGDSFTAAVTLGLLLGWPLQRISEAANEVAAYVCSCVGAIPQLPQGLREQFLQREEDSGFSHGASEAPDSCPSRPAHEIQAQRI